MKQFDVLLNISGNLEWVCEMYVDTVERAISDAIDIMGGGKYVGHNGFEIVDGAWVEIK
jgi:hypothetical protein